VATSDELSEEERATLLRKPNIPEQLCIRTVSKINRSNFLLHRPPVSKDTIGIGAVTGLARRAQTVRTRKFDYVTLSLGKLVRKPIKETAWRFGLASEAHRFFTGFGRTAKHTDTHGNDKNEARQVPRSH
jgi:hypothetical protein